MQDIAAVSVQVSTTEMADTTESAAAKPANVGKQPSLKRMSTRNSGMDVNKIIDGVEVKTELDRAVLKRLEEADENKDGQLSKGEVFGIVRDLVKERRSAYRYKWIGIAVGSLLLLSLAANFGLVVWGMELSKESHIAQVAIPTAAPASSASPVSAKSVMTAQADPGAVVATATATAEFPIYTSMELPAEALTSGKVEINYETPDYQGNTKSTSKTGESATQDGRRLDAGGSSALRAMHTMTVQGVDKISDTHIKFTGSDGTVVEVRDGVASVTRSVLLGEVMASTVFTGDRLRSQGQTRVGEDYSPSASSSTGRKLQTSATQSGYLTRMAETEIQDERVPLTTPICTRCSIRVGSDRVNSNVEELETRAVDKLVQLGVDVGPAKATLVSSDGRRKLSARTDTVNDFPASFLSACSDEVQEYIEPVLAGMAEAVRRVSHGEGDRSSPAAGGGCTFDSGNPLCRPGVDSTFGARALEIEHVGDLAARLGITFRGESRRRLVGSGDSQVRESRLYASEEIGRPADGRGSPGSRTEMFFADEGICGCETRVDNTTAASSIGAISFRGCNTTSWSEFYGAESRAIELNREARRPTGEAGAEAFGRPAETTFQPETRRLSAGVFQGLEGLGRLDIDDDNRPFDGFLARTSRGGIESLQFTRDMQYTGGRYVGTASKGTSRRSLSASSAGTGTRLGGESGRLNYPVDLRDLADIAADPTIAAYATLGTRVVGAIINSDGRGITSLAFIYKDDCTDFIEDANAYSTCKASKHAQLTF